MDYYGFIILEHVGKGICTRYFVNVDKISYVDVTRAEIFFTGDPDPLHLDAECIEYLISALGRGCNIYDYYKDRGS